MLRTILSTVLFTLLAFTTSAQLNVSYVGNITYSQSLSDIWGYTAPDGTEYAIVGVYDGVSVVSLADPANPTELFFFPGAGSTWRDIKTFDGYAYVTNETANGLAVIDLTGLPDEATAYDWAPNLSGLGMLSSIHNIWIDEFGVAYLAGSNLNNGGMLYVDVATTPGDPIFIDAGPSIYSHDVFTRNNIMYSSEIYAGVFTIYDVTDKSNTQTLGSSPTEGAFTHNAWLSDDNTILYTTDEVPNAPVGAYDVSDPTDVQELDQYRPFETLGDGVIPHNVHVWQDWLIVSYYTDGCIILDGSNPTNLVEVGNFDTYIPASTGFSGAWGAYPYLPSGLILISDIGNGMYVLEPNYVNACWLEGVITDATTEQGISGADISILGTIIFDESQAGGSYATGYAVAGSYDILIEKAGYESQTVNVELVNGEITELNVALIPLESFSASGVVNNALTGNGLGFAEVLIENSQFNYSVTADANGQVTLNGIFPGTYTVTAGSWGFVTQCETIELNEGNDSFTIDLQQGYYDDFTFDFGWTATGNAPTGQWERAIPVGTEIGGQPSNPGADVNDDCSGYAYVTGNGGPPVGNDDVDDGEVILLSPSFFYSPVVPTTLSYSRWFVNAGGNGTPNDEMIIELTDGNTTVELENISNSSGSWQDASFILNDILSEAGLYSLRVTTSDGSNTGHIVEGGLDAFYMETQATGVEELTNAVQVQIAPNPSTSYFDLNISMTEKVEELQLVVVDALARQVESKILNTGMQTLRIGEDWTAGVYSVMLMQEGNVIDIQRVVKH
ncbi:MAG: choice-of-anchor B family protein [Flavobacteriales bacterium]|nr:choice-of-anchor B family protein [Flavobacteriales bacterium]